MVREFGANGSNIMIHHNFYHKKMNMIPDEIDVSQVSFTLAWPDNSFDYFDVDV